MDPDIQKREKLEKSTRIKSLKIQILELEIEKNRIDEKIMELKCTLQTEEKAFVVADHTSPEPVVEKESSESL